MNSAVSVRVAVPAASPPGWSTTVSASDARRQQEPAQVVGVGQRRGRPPPRRAGDPPGGPPRGPVGRGHHAEERAVPHQHDLAAEIRVSEPGQVGDPRGRPHHPAVGHARQDQIVQEPRTPGHLVRDVQPRGAAPGHGPLTRRPGRHRRIGGPVQHSRLRQRPVAQPGRTVSGPDLPVGHRQCRRRDLEPGRGGGPAAGRGPARTPAAAPSRSPGPTGCPP